MFISQPSSHKKFIDLQRSIGTKVSELTRLSDTRWNCRAENCEAVRKNYSSIIELLREEIEQNENRNAIEAVGLLKCIRTMNFLTMLYVMTDILNLINILSKKLQSKQGTLAEATTIINSVISTLEDKRCDETFNNRWRELEKVAR